MAGATHRHDITEHSMHVVSNSYLWPFEQARSTFKLVKSLADSSQAGSARAHDQSHCMTHRCGRLPMEKGTFTSVPPRGTAYTEPPSASSQPATMSPACNMFCTYPKHLKLVSSSASQRRHITAWLAFACILPHGMLCRPGCGG